MPQSRASEAMSDPKGAYFAWRTSVARRDSFPDIDFAVEQVLRECWGAAYDRGRKDGVLVSANLRSAADSYREFAELLERWEREAAIEAGVVA